MKIQPVTWEMILGRLKSIFIKLSFILGHRGKHQLFSQWITDICDNFVRGWLGNTALVC